MTKGNSDGDGNEIINKIAVDLFHGPHDVYEDGFLTYDDNRFCIAFGLSDENTGNYNTHGGNIIIVTKKFYFNSHGRRSPKIKIIPLYGNKAFLEYLSEKNEELTPELIERVVDFYGTDGEKIERILDDLGYKKDLNLFVPHSGDSAWKEEQLDGIIKRLFSKD